MESDLKTVAYGEFEALWAQADVVYTNTKAEAALKGMAWEFFLRGFVAGGKLGAEQLAAVLKENL